MIRSESLDHFTRVSRVAYLVVKNAFDTANFCIANKDVVHVDIDAVVEALLVDRGASCAEWLLAFSKLGLNEII